MSVAIKVENLSKAYQIGEISTGTVSRDIERWWAKKRGKEDPFLKIGESNDRSVKGKSNVVWSLRDLNFEIEQGDAVGIIGRNGAGKSTLLKLLSRVTAPTSGIIKAKGRIASLLEVGTGFHPDLTGRENIFLNGAILGMRKKEILKHFDAIVDFAGVERYIDTPVKRYSSGMYVRLAFAVAAHLESEILIVDEVLAVGDAEFQKKCLGKMGEVSKGEGRTVLFVSHNMGSIIQLCNKGMLLDKGKLVFQGETNIAVEKYIISGKMSSEGIYTSSGESNKKIFLSKATLIDGDFNITDQFSFDESINLSVEITIKNSNLNELVSFTVLDKFGDYLFTCVEELSSLPGNEIKKDFLLIVPGSVIAPNSYSFRIAIFRKESEVYDLVENICSFKINDTGTPMSSFEGWDYGKIILQHKILVPNVV